MARRRKKAVVRAEKREGELANFLCSSLTPRKSAAEKKPRREVAPEVEELPALPVTRLAPKVGTVAWGASLLMHTAVLGVATVLVARAAASMPEPAPKPLAAAPVVGEQEVELDLPPMVEVTTLLSPAVPKKNDAASPPTPSGGELADARPDTERAGRGGMPEVSEAALNMADRDEAILLAKDLQSRLDRSQVQRLRVGDERASLDDRRATWQPMELTFIATGQGKTMERRALAELDPSRGVHAALRPGVLGGVAGASPLAPGEGERARDAGTARAGGDRASPAQGVLSGADGIDRRESAASAFARPQVTEARPAVPATTADKPKDNKDSDQEVASAVQSLLHASTAGGKQGAGSGGEKGPDKPGAGGPEGAGSKAKAAGPGGGGPVDANDSDSRLFGFKRQIEGRIPRSWINGFPKEAALEGKGGIVNITLLILPDGRVSWAAVTRASGVPEFDAHVLRLVQATAMPPLPPQLNLKSFRVTLVFDAFNAAVR